MKKLKPETVFILAAGLGTRLEGLTKSNPKALVEIQGKTLLEINLKKLKKLGFRKAIINLHHYPDQIKAYLSENANFSMEVIFSDETDHLLDTGGALLKALPIIANEDAVLVHNVDILTDCSIPELYSTMNSNNADAVMMVRARNSSRKLLFDNDLKLCGWLNSKKEEVKYVDGSSACKNAFAFSGIHLLRPEMIQGIRLQKMSLIDLYLKLASSNRIVGNIQDEGYWFDYGKIEQTPEINHFFSTTDL